MYPPIFLRGSVIATTTCTPVDSVMVETSPKPSTSPDPVDAVELGEIKSNAPLCDPTNDNGPTTSSESTASMVSEASETPSSSDSDEPLTMSMDPRKSVQLQVPTPDLPDSPPPSQTSPVPEGHDLPPWYKSMPTIVEDEIACDTIHTNRSASVSYESTLHSQWDPYMSLEQPPNIDMYNMTIQKYQRPTLPELMHGALAVKKGDYQDPLERSHSDAQGMSRPEVRRMSSNIEQLHFKHEHKPQKYLTWLSGVYVPAFTNIVGTILYMRMGTVAGHAGILGGIGIVLFSTFIISITALSLTGICSNGKTRKGGLYYIVSRALGPQVGGVISIVFSLANIGMAAVYITSCAEYVSDALVEYGLTYISGDKTTDNRIFSMVIGVIIMLITFMGPKVEQNVTWFFFSTYFISYLDWCIGTFLPVSRDQAVRGVTGYSLTTTAMNFLPEWRGSDFFTMFAVFFPGFTGMLAATMYVDQLQNPGTDVAKGLFSCIASTAGMYLFAVIACGATSVRDADMINEPVFDNSTGLWKIPPDCAHGNENGTCKYGLMNHNQIAEIESAWTPLLTLGIFGMTISSTMTNLDQGPLNFQAACKDQIFPYMKYFAKEYGPNNEPRRAYVFFGVITLILSLVGDTDTTSTIVTNLFMLMYALVNYAVFDASFAQSPGWRPDFKYYNMWVSLLGAILNICVMFVISIEYSLGILVITALTMAYFHYWHPEVNWGDTNQAHTYRNALNSLYKLTSTEIHVKNYRPQILLLTGNPASRVPLLDFANSITKGNSLLIAAHVLPVTGASTFLQQQAELTRCLEHWLKKNKVKAFYVSVANENLRAGAQSFIQTVGIGRLKPNVIMVGFKTNWWKLDRREIKVIDDYVGVLRDAFEANYGVGILRNRNEGFDRADTLLELKVRDIDALKNLEPGNSSSDTDPGVVNTLLDVTKDDSFGSKLDKFVMHNKFYSDKWVFETIQRDAGRGLRSEALRKKVSIFNLGAHKVADGGVTSSPALFAMGGGSERDMLNMNPGLKINDSLRRSFNQRTIQEKQDLADHMNRFHKPIKQGVIDVWWLYDDGGLTMLIPHLLRMPKSYLEGGRLRIFTLATSQAFVDADEANIAAMLTKFRISFANVMVIRDIGAKPHKSTIHEFELIIERWRQHPEETTTGYITAEELKLQKYRTSRQLRTRELLELHSKESSLIVITLPIPRQDISSCLYMAWLDIMTRNLPPVLFLRGNQTSVLSYYA